MTARAMVDEAQPAAHDPRIVGAAWLAVGVLTFSVAAVVAYRPSFDTP